MQVVAGWPRDQIKPCLSLCEHLHFTVKTSSSGQHLLNVALRGDFEHLMNMGLA